MTNTDPSEHPSSSSSSSTAVGCTPNETFLSFINADVAANNGNGNGTTNHTHKDSLGSESTNKSTNDGGGGGSAPMETLDAFPGPLPLYRSTSTFQPLPPPLVSLPPRPPHHHHVPKNRSWGNTSATAPAAVAATEGGTSNNERPPLDRQALSMRLRQAAAPPPISQNQHRVTIDDLLGQGRNETEAETNILAAFEQHHHHQQQQQQPPAVTAASHHRETSNLSTSSIFSNVPEHLAMDMILDLPGSNPVLSSPQSFKLSPKAATASSPALMAGSAPEISSSSAIQGHRRTLTSHSQLRKRQQQQQQHQEALEHQRHRRMLSTEDQLAGLHFAMSALDDHHLNNKDNDGDVAFDGVNNNDDDDNDTYSESSSNEHNNLAGLKVGGDDNHPLGNNPSAGDLLGHHAGLILMEGGVEGHNNSARVDGLRQRKNTEASLPPVLEEMEGGSGNPMGNDVEEGQNSSSAALHPNSPDNADEEKKKRRNPDSKQSRRSTVFRLATEKVKDDLDAWQTFFRPHKEQVWQYMRRIICYIVAPLVGIAAILFYLVDNPPTGKATGEERNDPGTTASSSWWLLFAVRQVLTFSMALGMQSFVIDFLCIGTRAMVRLAGPILTLLIVQSKGWPFVLFSWGVFDFALLFGDHNFARNWLYFQEFVGLFNSKNPSGNVVGSDWNRRILLMIVIVSFVTALKRFLVGLYLGRQTFHHFGAQLAKVMNKMVLIAEVATISKRIQNSALTSDISKRMQAIHERIPAPFSEGDEVEETENLSIAGQNSDTGLLFDATNRNPITGSLDPSEKMKLMLLLERWEEPERQINTNNYASIASVLKFRNALTCIKNDYPFSYSFGLADTRQACLESSQDVYGRLLYRPEDRNPGILSFDTLALIAVRSDGQIDQMKAKDLMRVFRPDRNGYLSVLDFIKSVDAVYKELRFLQASIENSSRIDKSFENIVNVVYFAIVIGFVLSQLGLDPFALFLSLSSVILAFAFAIGMAASKYIEGLLFILVRRPYGIGDMVHVSNVESDTILEGSVGWTVNNVTLFETEMTWLPTQERCSISNGSLANSRIINWARSPTARFVIFLIFPIETPYETL